VQEQKKHYVNFFKGKSNADITHARIAKLDALVNFLETSGARAAATHNTIHESRWIQMFQVLCAYQQEHGHCIVPVNYQIGTDKLGNWCSSQRRNYKNWMEAKGDVDAAFTQERIDMLNSIGFPWTQAIGRSPEDTWSRKFDLLAAYHLENGNCRVPESYIVDGVKLGRWVQGLRSRYMKMLEDGKVTDETLNTERVAKLKSIDFASSCRPIQEILDEEWNKKFELLREYQLDNGHTRVPQRFATNNGCKLGRWVADQRRSYKNLMNGKCYKASITQERIDKLNSIAFEWRCGDDKDVGGVRGWDNKFDMLLAFKHSKGHCRVPSKYIIDQVKLGQWVSDQRKFAKRLAEGKENALISQERIDQLNSVGFEWEIPVTKTATSKRGTNGQEVATADVVDDDKDAAAEWELQFERYCNQREGHRVSQRALERWANDQREQYGEFLSGKPTSLTAEQIEKLNSIDFDWATPNGQQRVTGV